MCGPDSLAVGLARVGHQDQFICFGTLKELRQVNFGSPLHSLILCAPDVHEMELEMLNYFHVSKLPQEAMLPEETAEVEESEESEVEAV